MKHENNIFIQYTHNISLMKLM